MSAQHTQGRLTVAGPTIQGGEDACGVPLAIAHMLNPYAGATGAADRVEANARRLVACWNACEGLTTETLEVAGSGIAPSLNEIFEEHGELMAQRDELLGICQRVVDRGIGASDVAAMRAAISKVKGGAA